MKFATKILLISLVFNLSGSFIFADEKHHPATTNKSEVTKKTAPKKSSHVDHNPKHGGQFFMAPNKFHHLEGVMASATEFRVYFYNNYTKPISAVPFKEGSKMEVQPVGPDGRETGTPLQLAVTADPPGAFLSAAIPSEMKLPLYFTTWLMFPNQKDPDLFNFSFDKVSVSADQGMQKNGVKKMTMYQCPMQDSEPQDKPGKCPMCGMNLEIKTLDK